MIRSLERQGIGQFQAFLVYRRGDAHAFTYRVADAFKRVFGRDRLFMDIDAIPLGVDYAQYIREAISSTSVVINIVGPHWLESRDPHGTRRIDNELDFLRIELEAAIRRNIPIINVLQHGATLPRADALPSSLRPLTTFQSVAISDAAFERDMTRLTELAKTYVHGANGEAAGGSSGGETHREHDSLGDKFFFSYSRKDEVFALQLYDDLKRVPLPVWIDQRDIPVGVSWEDKVEDALKGAGAIIAILSGNSVVSESVRNEIHYALELKKVVVPVMKENCTKPLRIVRLQHIDFTADYSGPMRKLAGDLVRMTRH